MTVGDSTELADDLPLPDARSREQHSHAVYVAVTIAIALWQGMIGVLVKWSTWPPVAMVWARCVVTVVALWLFARWRAARSLPLLTIYQQSPRCLAAPIGSAASPPAPSNQATWAGAPHGRTSARITTWGSGALLAGHWIALFLGYRLCNVGPVVVALFTFPVMAAIAEPWFFRQPRQRLQLLTAGVATLGVAAMRLWGGDIGAPEGGAILQNTLLGIALGLLSAAFFTARSIIARRLLRRSNAVEIMYEQAIVVAVLLLPSAWLLDSAHWTLREVRLLLALGVGFTAIPHTLGVWSMKKLTVATSGVVGSLQTVSTLVLARLCVGEAVTYGVWLGAAAVMLAVAIESLSHARTR